MKNTRKLVIAVFIGCVMLLSSCAASPAVKIVVPNPNVSQDNTSKKQQPDNKNNDYNTQENNNGK